jgi:hypothetical protein
MIGGLLAFLLWLVYYIESNGQNKEIIEQQKIETVIQHEIIKEKKQVFKRRQINNSVTDDANVEWMFKNRCKDC